MPLIRQRIDVRGRVQGVGFRPFVWRLARELALAGGVGNDSHGAFIEVEGEAEAVQRFRRRLEAELPPLATIAELRARAMPLLGQRDFRIEASARDSDQEAEITPDAATCADCLRELREPTDRRYRYPFINCTNCGPRYSIVQGVPYDRPRTTMRAFPMCEACRAEYEEPRDRRFHAQPNACPACGPRLWLEDAAGERLRGEPVAEAARCLLAGQLLGVKGLGGFHLACRADDDAVVRRLREAKGRDAKPFALMVADLAGARRLARLSRADEAALSSWQAPILIAPARPDHGLAAAIAPGLHDLGIMLPYTPLHHLLLAAVGMPIVLTSANPSGEPLCADNDEARQRLAPLADALLLHDRDIARRLDDSVLLARPDAPPLPVRRARGFVPMPLRLAMPVPRPVLALGGDLKATVCLAQDQQAILSEHLGDLENPAAFRNFLSAIERLRELLRIAPACVAHDLHPAYHTTRQARAMGLPTVAVQHHHAHIAAVMAEHGLTGAVLGLSVDGTGYGTDGAIWGCEILRAEGADFQRLGHLRYVAIAGGDRAAIDTWRPAICYLTAMDQGEAIARLLAGTPAPTLAARPLPAGVPSSSLGRLFDAVGALLGLCFQNRYEAEAAMTVEAVATAASSPASLPPGELLSEGGIFLLDPRPMLSALVEQRLRGAEPGPLAMAFHDGLVDLLARGLERCAESHGGLPIVLSGGCLLNRLLLGGLVARLEARGLRVCLPRDLPPGDGALSLGQVLIAAHADEALSS